MSSVKLEAAKELIREKKYAEARAILLTIDDPFAKQLIDKIDKVTQGKYRPAQSILDQLPVETKQQRGKKGKIAVQSSPPKKRRISALQGFILLSFCLIFSAIAIAAPKDLAPTPTASNSTVSSSASSVANSAIGNISTEAESLPKLHVISNSLNVRSGPGTNYLVLGSLKKDDVATIVGQNEDSTWVVIQFNKLRGWIIVNNQYISVDGDLTNVALVVAPPTPRPAVKVNPTSSINTELEDIPQSQPTTILSSASSCPSTCNKMASCAQAKQCLAQGDTNLDRDGDGIPCETLCKK